MVACPPAPKSSIPGSEPLIAKLWEAIGFPERRPLIIAIDGRPGAGKSTLACWLAWQLEMPALSLDVYLVRDSRPLAWRSADLERAICSRIGMRRPVILEGIGVCAALQAIDREPDFLGWIENAAAHARAPVVRRKPISPSSIHASMPTTSSHGDSWKQLPSFPDPEFACDDAGACPASSTRRRGNNAGDRD